VTEKLVLQGPPPGWVLRCLKTDAKSASVTSCFFKKSDTGRSLKKKPVPVKVSDACCLFHLHMTISDAGLGLVLLGSVQRFFFLNIYLQHVPLPGNTTCSIIHLVH
jgi:hypothetical protein